MQHPREGDVVVDAFVGARLLGLPLLTLKACVVVAKESGPPAAGTSAVVLSAAGQTPRLEDAMALVEQSADTLRRSLRGSRSPRSLVR
jgi:hypothetical protein